MTSNSPFKPVWGSNLGDRQYYRAALDSGNTVDADGSTAAPGGKPIGQHLGTTTLYPARPDAMG